MGLGGVGLRCGGAGLTLCRHHGAASCNCGCRLAQAGLLLLANPGMTDDMLVEDSITAPRLGIGRLVPRMPARSSGLVAARPPTPWLALLPLG